jgi:hypothetical protein
MEALKQFYRKYKAEIRIGIIVFVVLVLWDIVKRILK